MGQRRHKKRVAEGNGPQADGSEKQSSLLKKDSRDKKKTELVIRKRRGKCGGNVPL